jgi:diaminopimelate decarboxylase
MARIDDCLSTAGGHLWIEGCDAVDLVQKFGSPLFVVSEDQLRRNARRFVQAFGHGWRHGPVTVMPAAKANWSRAALRVLADEGCGADVYSAGELSACLDAGIPPERISVNGVPKDPDHVRRTLTVGARLTIDDVGEVDLIERLVRELGVRATVRLRVRPTLRFSDASDFVAEGLVPTDLAALTYKGGLPLPDVIAAGRRLLANPSVDLVGLHQHHGRHHASTRFWEAQMRSFADVIAEVSRALGGWLPRELDIGGGFAIPRDPHNAATHYGDPAQLTALYGLSKALQPFGQKARLAVLSRLAESLVEMAPNATPAPTIEEYAAVATGTLGEALDRHGIPTGGVALHLEPGRALHGDAGVHLATVRAVKRMTDPLRWNVAVLDTTEFWFTGGRYEHHLHDFRVASKVDAPAEEKADICGRSCYGDRILPTVRVPRLEPGDVFAFLDTGAYQEASCSNFNALPRPAMVLVTGDRAAVIRRRETEADVFARDEVPAHLSGRLDDHVQVERRAHAAGVRAGEQGR